LDRIRRGNKRFKQPAMRGLIVKAPMPQYDAPRLGCIERQLSDFDWIGSAEFLSDLAAVHSTAPADR
jgi:hypothetical protein